MSASGGKVAGFFARRFWFLALASLVTLVLIEVLAPFWWRVELFTHFRLQHTVVTGLLALGLLVYRRWWGTLVAVVATVLAAVPLVPYYRVGSPVEEAGGDVVKLVSANVFVGNTEKNRVLGYLEAEDPDIVLLLEVDQEWVEALVFSGFAGRYAHKVFEPREDSFGIGLLSRIPLEDYEVMGGPAGVPSILATVRGGGRGFRFLGTHPVPPTGKEYAAARNEQLRWCSEIAATETGPFILAGDLNASPFSPHFRELLKSGGLTDMRKGWGRGLPATWSMGVPGLGLTIDHCLIKNGITVRDWATGPAVGSDHRPVVVEFSVSP